jgi:hypothetical protein
VFLGVIGVGLGMVVGLVVQTWVYWTCRGERSSEGPSHPCIRSTEEITDELRSRPRPG